MNQLDAMRVFATVVEAGSLSAAGRRLGMPLATVSRKLSDLEAHLNTRLLLRSTRKLQLTDAGRDYLAAAQDILERMQQAEQSASGAYVQAKGRLVVSAPLVFGRLHVLPVVAEFLKAQPEVDVRLCLSDRFPHLLEEHVDVALRIGHLQDSGLVATRLGQVQRLVCASPGYVAEHGRPRRWADLARHSAITFEGLASAHEWPIVDAGRARMAPVRTRLAVTSAEAAIAAAELGLGVTQVLSYQVAEHLAQGRLLRLLKAHEPPPMPVHLVHAGQGLLPMKLRAFWDFAAPRLRQRLA